MSQRDVVILGSGLAGSVVAACLARAGLDVLVVDAARHPRFAIGESTIPYTSIMARLISERYDVPEIKYLSSFDSVQKHVSSNCGKKRNFGFVYHRPGLPHDPTHTNQFPISPNTHSEVHFMRADVDHWLIKVAERYGAELREDTRVTDVETNADGVQLQLDDGDRLFGKFVIDASGFRSPLAQKFGLREEPTRLRTHSRSIFTHMTGVIPFEDTFASKSFHGNPSPWSEGTLHHIFPGGWMWVIPFDNHSRSTSDLCSVGISFDPRIHPKPDGDPANEFTKFCSDFPDVARQFTGAQAVRPWVSTARLQYSSSRTIGYRWCLTAHAAGFIDALFSRGMQNTMSVAHSLISRVIDAVREDDFSVERFEHVQNLEQGLLDINDDLVANAYTSFCDWDLWNAWFRIWETNQVLSTTVLGDVYARYAKHHDLAQLEPLATLEPRGAIPSYLPARELIAKAGGYLQDVQDGRGNAGEAADKIFELLGAADFVPPLFGLAQRSNRWYDVKLADIIRTAVWARMQAPPEIGRLFSDGLGTLFAQEFGFQLRHRIAQARPGSQQRQ
jgi:FADH2 O2-dependent halogenase